MFAEFVQGLEYWPEEFRGRSWASSSTTTLPAILCNLRHRLVRLAKRDSKNCTLVVTITGHPSFRRQAATGVFPALHRIYQGYCGAPPRNAENLPELIRSLFYDAGIGNHIDDPLLPVNIGMVQRKSHGGQGFASSGRNGETENSGGDLLPFQYSGLIFGPDSVDH